MGLPNLDIVFAFWAIVPSWVIVPLLMLDQGLPVTESALASFRTPDKVSFRLNYGHVNYSNAMANENDHMAWITLLKELGG